MAIKCKLDIFFKRAENWVRGRIEGLEHFVGDLTFYTHNAQSYLAI